MTELKQKYDASTVAVMRQALNEIVTDPHPRSNDMTPHIPERLTDWSPFVITGNTMPPRDPDEDEDEEDEDEEEEDADEPPVVREPDED
jgi:hypothetical protein